MAGVSSVSPPDSTVTRVKQNLGEIGHSAGTAPQVAITFGKNSSNATSHSESVTHSGSTLIGAGDITLRATGNGQTDTNGNGNRQEARWRAGEEGT